MENQASQCLENKEWSRAIDLYTKLLESKSKKSEHVVTYLLGRSEGFFELGKHEASVSDCKTVIQLLSDKHEDHNENRARQRLVHALYAMKRFEEAKMAARQWLAVLKMKNDIAIKELLENFLEIFMKIDYYSSFIISKMHQLLIIMEIQCRNNLKQPETPTCIYCNVSFRTKGELRAHCQSAFHQRVVMSDDGRDWWRRPPPSAFPSGRYELCENWEDTWCCLKENECVNAHGVGELSEWRERFSYRQMKLQRAREKELYGKSYTDQVLEKLTQSTNVMISEVMQDSLPDVKVISFSPLKATVFSKNSVYEWFFTITTSRTIKAVALLEDTHRNHFYIGKVITQKKFNKIKNNQEWLAPEQIHDGTKKEYMIGIEFTTSIFGTFRQSVVFDFGTAPVLVRHLCIDVVPPFDFETINEIRRELTLTLPERWSASNADIVKSSSVYNSWEQRLLDTYKCPQAGSFTLSHATLSTKKFTRNNYRETMHELLYMDEMASIVLLTTTELFKA